MDRAGGSLTQATMGQMDDTLARERVAAAVTETEGKAKLLEAAGFTQAAEPYMLDVVCRAREQAEVTARIP